MKKQIHFKFLFKYLILAEILVTLIFTLLMFITQFIFKQYNFVIMIIMLISIGLMFILTSIYDRIILTSNKTIEEYILLSLNYFAYDKYSDLEYSEAITWFSKDIHNFFRMQIDVNSTTLHIINTLHLILRPNYNGLCIAFHHKTDFRSICDNIIKEYNQNINNSNLSNITIENTLIEEMVNSKMESLKFLSFILDKNLFFYFIIVICHIAACVLSEMSSEAFNLYSFMSNFLFYIPADILIILIYKGLVKEHQHS